jgi:hydroxyacylglutathione hydrolase
MSYHFNMRIIPIPALKDNYIWLLISDRQQSAWVVDPGEASGVLEMLKKLDLKLAGILITHHHYDHCGGVAELLSVNPNVQVFGSTKSSNQYINCPVGEGKTILCLGRSVNVLEIPGHTLDHVAYHLGNALFCGDTLFSVGCGKVFEGTAQQMYDSLNKLSSLSDDTQIYCGHEYTLANLQFAYHVDPQNRVLQQKLKMVSQQKGCTLPSLLKEEKQINPFLRCNSPEIISSVENHAGKKLSSPVEVFHHLREWKNIFKT